jgi:hypothetical protein
MKSTIVMLAVIATFIITWLLLSLLPYLLTDDTYKQACIEKPLLVCIFVLGWIPSLVIGIDLDERL